METEMLMYGGLAAVLVGLAKTGVPGVGILVVPLLALIWGDAKGSVGALLPLLIVADIFAVRFYHYHAQWKLVRRLAPWIAIGLLLGFAALRWVEADIFKPFLGGLVLVLLGLEFLRLRMQWTSMPHHPLFTAFMGMLTGFATMAGNVAGPVANIYMLCHGLKKKEFMGSMAWLFLIVNCCKLPFFAAAGILTRESLGFDLMVLPGIVIGALLGRWLLPRIPQRVFTFVVLGLAGVSALLLVLK